MGGAVEALTIRRSQSCKRSRQSVSILPSRSSRFTALMPPAGGHPPPVEASLCPGVLPEANAMSGRYRSLRLVAPLVARAPGTWSHRAADAAGLREALCQTAEE